MPDRDDAGARDDASHARAPLNREERRRARFGPTRTSTGAVPDGPEPGTPPEAEVRTSNQGSSRLTGAGTGGATETDGRQPEHEGVHQPSRPNG